MTLIAAGVTPAGAEKRWVDIDRSTVAVYLSPTEETPPGGRGYVMEAPLAEGSLDDTESPHLALVINVDQFRLLEPKQAADERAAARARLLGPEGLDRERFSRITYHSLTIDQLEGGVWLVKGELEMHGRFLPLNVRAVRQGKRFTGTAIVSPADFGIRPMRLAGASTLVGREVRVVFDVVLEAR